MRPFVVYVDDDRKKSKFSGFAHGDRFSPSANYLVLEHDGLSKLLSTDSPQNKIPA